MTREEIMAMEWAELKTYYLDTVGMELYYKEMEEDTFTWHVEETIRKMGLKREYTKNLSNIATNNNDCDLLAYIFTIVHASPIDRLRAALLTIKGVV